MPTFALNFYSPVVADQLRTGRKTATIRLGDKSTKYRKGMIVTVLVGARYGQREKVFDAVIDKVEVKRSPTSRRARSSTTTPRSAAPTSSSVARPALQPDVTEDDTVTVIRFSQIVGTMFYPAQGARALAVSGRRIRPDRAAEELAAGARRRTPRTRPGTPTRPRVAGRAARDELRPALRAARRPLGLGSSKKRATCPHDGQNATQWPRVLRRSSWIQFRFGFAIAELLPAARPGRRPGAVADADRPPDERVESGADDAPGRGSAQMAVREAEPVGSLQEVKEAGLDREDLLGIYRNMLITRGIEERGHILYKQGKIPGSFYTGRGNEASAVGVATAMGPNDVGTPLQRDMGVHITRGIEPWRVFAQYMGRADGPTQGRDGNVHIGDARLGLHAMVSHLPAMLPVAVGMALAFRIREEKRVAVAWCGEGASARGDAHEGMNLAGVRRLPVVFVIDNNQWAYSTPTYLEYAVEHLADRAAAYGFDGVVVDGTDVLAVYREAKRAIEKAREGGGPTLIESVTLRMEGHAVHDDAFYVPKELFEEWARRDPIERFRSWLRDNAAMTDDEEDEITAASSGSSTRRSSAPRSRRSPTRRR